MDAIEIIAIMADGEDAVILLTLSGWCCVGGGKSSDAD